MTTHWVGERWRQPVVAPLHFQETEREGEEYRDSEVEIAHHSICRQWNFYELVNKKHSTATSWQRPKKKTKKQQQHTLPYVLFSMSNKTRACPLFALATVWASHLGTVRVWVWVWVQVWAWQRKYAKICQLAQLSRNVRLPEWSLSASPVPLHLLLERLFVCAGFVKAFN